MNISSYGALPGITAIRQNTERAIWWGREHFNLDFSNLVILSTTIDAGSSPTSDLRSGLVLGKVTASSKLTQWNPDGSDGSEAVAGVLMRDLSMLSDEGVVEDKYGHVLLAGCVRAADLFIEGTAFTSSADQYLARNQMVGSGRFIFDDDVLGGSAFLGVPLRTIQAADTTLVPTVGQNGSRFVVSNAGAVAITLPALKAGLVYEFLRTANEEIVVASAAGDDMIVGNDVAADSVTFTTSGQQIGALIRVEGIYVGTTAKWLVTFGTPPFGTGLTGGFAYSIAS